MSAPPKLRIAGVVDESIVDGPGFRFTIFVQGCPHHCKDCHNPQTHDFAGGQEITEDQLLAAIDRSKLLRGVTLSGGEPFCQAAALVPLVRQIRQRGLDIFAYSGYTWEQLLATDDPAVRELLELCDFLVDGPYIAAQRDLTLAFRGSSNQRIIDLNATRHNGKFVLAKF